MFQVFFYYETSYLPTQGRFKGHVVWSGDVMEKDASITLQQVSPAFNIPDVVGRNGEVVLRVVNKTESRLFFTPNDTLISTKHVSVSCPSFETGIY